MNFQFPKGEKRALFLDFDGTLVPFAETPDGVVVPPDLVQLLSQIERKLDGAFAFVTGRAIDNLDQLLGTNKFKAVGVHGAEWRLDNGEIHAVEGKPFDQAQKKIAEFCDADPGLTLQKKSSGFTLHFRLAAHLKLQALEAMQQAFKGRDDFEIMGGELMWEARRKGIHKGVGIERLMKAAPFAGRIPVFVGDDVTDEDGHATVNEMDGYSIKVGQGKTVARHRLADIDGVYDLLNTLVGKAQA